MSEWLQTSCVLCAQNCGLLVQLEYNRIIKVKGDRDNPHGFGLFYLGDVHGINVNRLTKNTHRDRLAAAPLHRYVPCRVEKIGSE